MPITTSPINSRTVLYGVRWETYEALLRDRGDSGPRICFDRGTLEIMSPLRKHEWVVSLLKRFVEILTFELGIKIASAGSTTLKSQFKDRGVEPDGSYYVQNEPHIRFKDDFDITVDPPPDLAIEVDITSSSVDKFGVYAAFEVPELWTYDHEAVRMFVLQPTGGYVEVARSLAFPQLTSEVLNRFLRRRKVVDETTLVHEFCAWVRNTSAQGAGTAG